MMSRRALALVLVIGSLACAPRAATPDVVPAGIAPARASSRPLPQAVTPPASFLRAVERGTRTLTGRPGPRYWQPYSRYRLTAKLLVEEKRVEGTAHVMYLNRSPDSLAVLHLELTQNLHAAGAPRQESSEVTGGMELRRVTAGARDLRAAPTGGSRYQVVGTRLDLFLPRMLAAGDSVALTFDYAFRIPQAGASGRMGWDMTDLFFLAYWYPHVAVRDDVVGWQTDAFLGTAEFYHGFGSYDVTLDVPEGWIVAGTGALLNPAEVLSEPVLARLTLAESSDTIVHVVTPADFGLPSTRQRAGGNGRLQWRFRADSVRDVAYSITRASNWDAARAAVGDRDGDGKTDYTRVNALYRESAPRWERAAHYGRHAITGLSEYFTFPYPWPHMTGVEAQQIIGSGMEYPMMTLIGNYTASTDTGLYAVIAHEIAHMWVPMIASTDERRYGWMDEGWTTFSENQVKRLFFPGFNTDAPDRENYAAFARAGNEGEMMRWSDFHYTGAAYGIASYAKPASVMAALRGVLGEATFLRGYRDFLRAWAYRHPYPWDFFHAMEQAAGRDLDWFWHSWYFETWTLDHAVGRVTQDASGARIEVEDRGLAPMPARLTVTRADGSVVMIEVPVERWLEGMTRITVTVPKGAVIERVEIDAAHDFPDVNRGNNTWRRR